MMPTSGEEIPTLYPLLFGWKSLLCAGQLSNRSSILIVPLRQSVFLVWYGSVGVQITLGIHVLFPVA